ncbi:MAG: uroporphyrinogen-III C-methyltransferase [Aggregatilineales bacterium]
MSGKVYLIGAGPGDPDLMTVKGLRLVQQADVILYDRLVPFEVLEDARPDAELINVGKQPTKHRFDQTEINRMIVDYALRGWMVVRLKGGDPFVFGRGGEEALACHEAGIPFEIVPGVSSAFAVPGYAGIPLTHRHVSSTFTVVAGYEDPTKPESSVNYAALAQTGGTLVILMGVKQLPQISAQLIANGLDADTPAAIIEWGATPQQRVVEGTISTLYEQALAENIQPPSTIVIGDVVALRQQGLRWFDLIASVQKTR